MSDKGRYFIEETVALVCKENGISLPEYLDGCVRYVRGGPASRVRRNGVFDSARRDHEGPFIDDGNYEALQVSMLTMLYYASGQQVVQISDDMYEMLLRTDLRGVAADDLRLPYTCMYFSMPPGKDHAVTSGPETKGGRRAPCGGVYLRNQWHNEIPEDIQEKLGVAPEIMATGFTTEEPLVKLLEYAGLSMSDLEESQKDTIVVHAGAVFDDFTSIMASAATINNWVHFGRREWDKNSDLQALFDSLEGERRGRRNYSAGFNDMMKVALNAVVYLNHGLDTKIIQRRDDRTIRQFTKLYAEATSESKKQNYGRKVTRIAKPTIRLLGPGIKRGTVGLQSAVDVLVRGHWHTYWTGKGRTNRKLNWIQPYMRNRDKGVSPDDDPRVYQL